MCAPSCMTSKRMHCRPPPSRKATCIRHSLPAAARRFTPWKSMAVKLPDPWRFSRCAAWASAFESATRWTWTVSPLGRVCCHHSDCCARCVASQSSLNEPIVRASLGPTDLARGLGGDCEKRRSAETLRVVECTRRSPGIGRSVEWRRSGWRHGSFCDGGGHGSLERLRGPRGRAPSAIGDGAGGRMGPPPAFGVNTPCEADGGCSPCSPAQPCSGGRRGPVPLPGGTCRMPWGGGERPLEGRGPSGCCCC
mmetsp:Transcript_118652/g.336392  ORF Transcript_118652/g.336392 Transcript_118652/m.336392 type:complete len:251 (-) Transcript_118652:498-1250(-)